MAEGEKTTNVIRFPGMEEVQLPGDEQAPIEPGNTTKKRFKVAIVQMAAELRTIYAEDGDTAVKLVGEKNLGRHAGRQGPVTIAIAATDYDDPERDYIQTTVEQYISLGAERERQSSSRILKPQLVLPKGFNPAG